MSAVWTEEPEDDYANNAATETRLNDDDVKVTEAVLDRWDQDKWAENVTKQGFVQESKPKLQRRISDFLIRASAAERKELETGRARLLEVMKAAQSEQENRYPEPADESRQTRRQKAQAKIRAECRAFSEVTYEYSKIMDVLVSQAPEYVSLAWGAIKIVLVVQINHEELKQKVKGYMEQIKRKFEMIDHLTELIPRANLVTAVAKVYELFSRFLAKAVKYYSMNMSKARMTAFFKPWKVNLQSIVDAIDQTFADIKDISHFHGLLESHASLGLGRENLLNTEKSVKMHEESLERLSDVEQMLQQVHAMVISFSKQGDVQQTADLLWQRVNETLQEPEQSRKSRGQDETIPEHEVAADHTLDPYGVTDAESLLDNLFVELRESRQDASRHEMAIEQTSEMRGHRSMQRNIMRIEEVMAWVESESSRLLWINGHNVLRRSDFSMSFAAPLLVLGESNYETTIVLRHFCGESSSYEAKSYQLLVQALLYQIFEQYPKVLDRKKASLTRETTSMVTKLWDLFLDCLAEVNADCTFIIIENIDVLGKAASSNIDDGKFITQQLHRLVQESTKLIKILLIASLARDRASPSEGRLALMQTQRRESMSILQNQLALVPHKLIEIQQKRCKRITFAEMTMLYGPNTTVYTTENDQLRAFVLVELSGMEPRAFESYNALRMRAWSINHDGQNVVRRYHTLTVPQFSGQKEIACLRYIPAGFVPSESEKRRNLIARGKLWWKYSFGIHHVTTDSYKTQVGTTFLERYLRWKTAHRIDVLVPEGSQLQLRGQTSDKDREKGSQDYEKIGGVKTRGYGLVPSRVSFPPLLTNTPMSQAIIDQRNPDRGIDSAETTPFFEVLSAKSLDTLKPLYFLLCPPLIDVFMLQELKWAAIKVYDIKQYQYDTRSFDRMVLPAGHANKLKAVCESRIMGGVSKVSNQPTRELARRKKGGLVIELCGEFGVGKTLASGCIAEYTQRPLLSLSTSETGTDAKSVEKALRNVFKLAESWSAIVVLRDAEYYTEWASAFSRALDQFHGILVLLTEPNDSTILYPLQSCIHVPLKLPPFQEHQRAKLWVQLLHALEMDDANLSVHSEILKYLEHDRGLKTLKWNGKQMRNALQIAVALAEKDIHGDAYDDDTAEGSIILRQQHLEEAIQLSQGLQETREAFNIGTTEGSR